MDSLALFGSIGCGIFTTMAFILGWVIHQTRNSLRARVVNAQLRRQLQQAKDYQSRIQKTIATASKQRNRPQFEHLNTQITAWATDIEALVRQVDGFKQDRVMRRDLTRLPSSIKSLERKIAKEDNADLRARLTRNLESQQAQLSNLNRLQAKMREAEIEIERTLASLGTIYSQVVTGQSSKQVADYSHLSAEVDEQVNALDDYLEAIEEVYQSRS